MGAEKVGALIIIKQSNDLGIVEESGISIDAKVSTALLENIFFKNAPLHDGGVVINGDRVVAAKCVLPSTQQSVPKSYGMRHRAALGMSEVSDAIIIVVSEETGAISLAHDSVIKRNIDPQRLAQSIRELMRINNQRQKEKAPEV
jgi:DNA integrity scanning protein DisA with diadenylate cyclase activity